MGVRARSYRRPETGDDWQHPMKRIAAAPVRNRPGAHGPAV